MSWSIRNKLLLSFSIILVMIVALSYNTLQLIAYNESVQERIVKLRQPSVLDGQILITGINRSLAGLRGYIILGSDPAKAKVFKAERAEGWAEIDKSLTDLERLSKNWDDENDKKSVLELKTVLGQFRTAQQEIEDIANDPKNIPSINLLVTKAAPIAGKIIPALTVIINEEATLPATDDRKKLLKLLADTRGSFALGLANIRAYLLTGNKTYSENFNANWKVNTERFTDITKVENILSGSQQKEWETYKGLRGQFAPIPNEMFTLRSQSDWNLANYWLGTKAAPKARELSVIIESIKTSQKKHALEDNVYLAENTTFMIYELVIVTAIILVIGLFIAIFISQKLTTPIKLAMRRANEIARGDLSGQPIINKSGDESEELIKSLNTMTVNLRSVMEKFSVVGSDLTKAARELDSSTTITNQSLETQQQATMEIVEAMTHINDTVQDVTKSTVQASQSAESASSVSLAGSTAVESTVKSIHSLADKIEVSRSSINELGTETEGVDGIVAVIRGIADQTNLLALNAAIEAARAGEQGRGFAVVADEVRTLASRTQESTDEIQAVLERLRKGVNNVVETMGDSHELAQGCLGNAADATKYLTEINESISIILDINTHISQVSEQQNNAVLEVNSNMVNITEGAELILTKSRITSDVAAKTGVLTVEMDEMISKFKVS